MENIDYEVFLRIGQNMANPDYNHIEMILPTKTQTQTQYREEYISKLNKQLNAYFLEREQLLYQYNKGLEFNKKSIEIISYLNHKLGNNNLNKYSNSATNFLSLRMKGHKKRLQEIIESNINNSHKLYELEQRICDIDLYINKIKNLITVA
jgi:hypothetical protein